jgi:uncharacterized protein involved in type VI secretion and phage assembly
MTVSVAKQARRKAEIITALACDDLLLRAAVVREELCRPFEINAELASENPNVDLNAVIGKPAGIRLAGYDGHIRHFHGIVSACSFRHGTDANAEGLSVPGMTFAPRPWCANSDRWSRARTRRSASPRFASRVGEPSAFQASLRMKGPQASDGAACTSVCDVGSVELIDSGY